MMSATNSSFHESAKAHVTGKALYISDINYASDTLAGIVFSSPHARARIRSYDFSSALALPGLVDILDFKRIPGVNSLNPLVHDEPCLAEEDVYCVGQAIFLIVAETEMAARKAAKEIKIEFELLDPIITIDDAIHKNARIAPTREMQRGNPIEKIKDAPHQLGGQISLGGQEHWYLETHAAYCVPSENGSMSVFASSQNPTEVQFVVAEVLGKQANQVCCEVMRMGGGFGGKETQANHIAAWTALLAHATQRPVKMIFNRDEDQLSTGKRHPFQADYYIGFDDKGLILSYIVDLNGNAGYATDLSMAILERAMFHAASSYYIPDMKVTATMWRTNLPSNTAFRGFGGPQGMAVIEHAIDSVARFLKMDAAEVRYRNFYGLDKQNITHFGQTIENNRLFLLWDQLIKQADYFNRRNHVNDFNSTHEYVKRGLALTPVKFGISFTTSFLNQAGALVNIYKDGTVLLNHGGTEMGQGLHTKMIQIAATELGIDESKIRVSPTNTSKVPNTSPTAASSGTDLNGMAVRNAILTLKERLTEFAVRLLKLTEADKEKMIYEDDHVYSSLRPNQKILFNDLVLKAYMNQVSLSSTGFYGTPDLHFDKEKGSGRPFHYFAFGMAVSEVEVDILTGMTRLLRSDILHDAGNSINEKIDLGQVLGGFIQGVGWCTMVTLRYDANGKLLNKSPDTYKIPTACDIPEVLNVSLLRDAPNPTTIRQSKAVGEPPLMLALSVWLAMKDAVSSVDNHQNEPFFALPANQELILRAVKSLEKR
ncbi:MAG: xanthine dehydrogenase large subunit [Bacteroidetes bacterium]|nr:MAG: xanthine dehydrogenase large subunit [Bacteroidota bacterium]